MNAPKVTLTQQLSEAMYYFGLSYATTARLLSMARHELYAIKKGKGDLSPEKLDRLQWLWEVAVLWREKFSPVHYPPRFVLLDKLLRSGQTMHQVLQQQPPFDQLVSVLSELRILAQQHEQTLKLRRQQCKSSVYTPEQLRKIRLSLGKIMSFE